MRSASSLAMSSRYARNSVRVEADRHAAPELPHSVKGHRGGEDCSFAARSHFGLVGVDRKRGETAKAQDQMQSSRSSKARSAH